MFNTNENSPLDIDVDLTSVETTIPVLPAGPYDLRVDKMEREENKDKTGYNLVVTLKTTQPATATDGRAVNPGFPLKTWIPLQAKAGSDFDFRVKLAQLQEAALGEKKAKFSGAEIIGQVVRAQVKVEAGKDGEPPRNGIGALSQPK